jgi:hypothetical protein
MYTLCNGLLAVYRGFCNQYGIFYFEPLVIGKTVITRNR